MCVYAGERVRNMEETIEKGEGQSKEEEVVQRSRTWPAKEGTELLNSTHKTRC